MKSLVKKYLPQESIKFLTYLRNWNHRIYPLRDVINFETNLSDFLFGVTIVVRLNLLLRI